ncbi:MAG: AraC family transcriptional regulator [Bryobacteraceae bacterium]
MSQSSVAPAYFTTLPQPSREFALPQAPQVPLAGEAVETRSTGGFTFTERVYPGGFALPRHYHDRAYLVFTLEGAYSECSSAGNSWCAQHSLRYLPAGEVHSNNFEKNVRCLLIEIEPAVIGRLREYAAVLERPGEITGLNATWLANRLCRELRQRDDVSLVSLEGMALELLAAAARCLDGGPVMEAPRWLRKAREILDARFLAGVSLTELAAEAGVHAVHLSREFRKRFQCSVGEYMRKRRVEHACQLIANSEKTLSEIAMICGFADQSHFSKTFKRETGLTPAHFRTISAAG